MSDFIEIPRPNLTNIAIFLDEPDEGLIQEIKAHVRLTSSPHTWRGHSHTKPEDNSFVVYIDEFDVPAPDTVPRAAPCPCCNPHHLQYKNKGKIAWFPDEKVIGLIGPQCFAAINQSGHAAALVDLRKRQKRRSELQTIAQHRTGLKSLIDTIAQALEISADLDAFQSHINRALDSELQLDLWREVKGGNLMTVETRRVPFRKPDGSIGERSEEHRIPFGNILGHSMIDRSGQPSSGKLGPLRAGLVAIAARLDEAGTGDALTDAQRQSDAAALVKGRIAAHEILASMRERQLFLTSTAIEDLGRWGEHPSTPVRFSIARRRSTVVMSAWVQSKGKVSASVNVPSNATLPVPEIPPIPPE